MIVSKHRPETRTLSTRTNRLWYRCPPCDAVTEHVHSSTSEFEDGIISLWTCQGCDVEDLKFEDRRQFGR